MKRPRPDYAGAHARRLQLFRDLLDGQENDNGTPNTPFWDAVVLTAGDESQREIYEGAVAGLIEAGLVPTLATKCVQWMGFAFSAQSEHSCRRVYLA